MVNKSIISAACACLAVVSFNANAALVGRLAATPGGTDYQAYYDDVADLTWLADADYARTSGYTPPGVEGLSWADANAWAAGLDVAGVTGWRLPEADGSCIGYNCTGSESGDLYYRALGNPADGAIFTNSGPFTNFGDYPHWTATEYAADTDRAFFFYTGDGEQYINVKSNGFDAWAMQTGDVSAIPVPAAVWLFGSGLLGLIGVARSKRQS